MIEIIPTEKLFDDKYRKIVQEMLALRDKQLSHNFEINLLGTNSYFYSILDALSSPYCINNIRNQNLMSFS